MEKKQKTKIEKVVKRPNSFTKAGIQSCNSTERTLQLSTTASVRSVRLSRLSETIGANSIKEMSNITNISVGKMGRLRRSNSCTSTHDCFQIAERCFNNTKNKRYLVSPAYILGEPGAQPPCAITNSEISISDLLEDMLSEYGDSLTKTIKGLIEKNNAGEEQHHKRFVNIACIIDLFQATSTNARIAYISDPHSGIYKDNIVGYQEIQTNKLEDIKELNGAHCVIIKDNKSTPLVRQVFVLGDNLLCKSPSANEEGTFILKIQEKPHSIGKVGFYIALHEQLLRDMVVANTTAAQNTNKEDKENEDNDNIFVINNKKAATE